MFLRRWVKLIKIKIDKNHDLDKNQDFSHTEKIIGTTHHVVEHTETSNAVNTIQDIIDNINYLSEDSILDMPIITTPYDEAALVGSSINDPKKNIFWHISMKLVP